MSTTGFRPLSLHDMPVESTDSADIEGAHLRSRSKREWATCVSRVVWQSDSAAATALSLSNEKRASPGCGSDANATAALDPKRHSRRADQYSTALLPITEIRGGEAVGSHGMAARCGLREAVRPVLYDWFIRKGPPLMRTDPFFWGQHPRIQTDPFYRCSPYGHALREDSSGRWGQEGAGRFLPAAFFHLFPVRVRPGCADSGALVSATSPRRT